ncbi:MAG: DUF2147 domain-containing protein [Cytophagales bacterium]|nr:DUF2147 domain-containing protein [Cytophagales bacterium]
MRLLLYLVLSCTISYAQTSVVGKWKTIDDNTGEPRSIVEIFEEGGLVSGKVVRIFPRPNLEPDPICKKCSPEDPRFNKKVIGMEIIRGLKKSGDEYSGGDILDPENGRVYRSRIWVEDGVLRVRGYWGPFYRTQTWLRAD